MLTVMAEAIRIATRTVQHRDNPDVLQGGPSRPYPSHRHHKNWDAPKRWFDAAGMR